MKGILGFLFLLSPVILVVVWLGLTWLLWKGGRRFLRAKFANRPVQIALVVMVAAAWLGAAFWEVAGKKMYWDAKVRELCAKNGGIRVYETVELPAEMVDDHGRILIPFKKDAKSTDNYYLDSEIKYLKKGVPSLWKMHLKVIRLSDQKLLGESLMYARSGGDLPGPWHESSFKCPNPTQAPNLLSSIFKENSK